MCLQQIARWTLHPCHLSWRRWSTWPGQLVSDFLWSLLCDETGLFSPVCRDGGLCWWNIKVSFSLDFFEQAPTVLRWAGGRQIRFLLSTSCYSLVGFSTKCTSPWLAGRSGFVSLWFSVRNEMVLAGWSSYKNVLTGSKWRKQSLTDKISICSERAACQGFVICSDCIQNIKLYCRNRIKLFSRHASKKLVAVRIFFLLFVLFWFSFFVKVAWEQQEVSGFFGICCWSWLRCCAGFKEREEKTAWKKQTTTIWKYFHSIKYVRGFFSQNATCSRYYCEIASIWAVIITSSVFQLEILNLSLTLLSLVLALGWNSAAIPGPISGGHVTACWLVPGVQEPQCRETKRATVPTLLFSQFFWGAVSERSWWLGPQWAVTSFLIRWWMQVLLSLFSARGFEAVWGYCNPQREMMAAMCRGAGARWQPRYCGFKTPRLLPSWFFFLQKGALSAGAGCGEPWRFAGLWSMAPAPPVCCFPVEAVWQ